MPKSIISNHFDYNGIYVEGTRSVFRFHKPVLTAGMSGMLIPAGDPIPLFPGVKTDLKMNMVIRSNTMVVPPLDGIYIDTFAVWVPHRIVWNHMPQFLGENDTTAWTQSSNYNYPNYYLVTAANGSASVINAAGIQGDVVFANNFLNCHYGIATKTSMSSSSAGYGKSISVLAHRGYYAIWNFLFRDENYQRPVLYSKGDTGNAGEFGYLVRDYKAAVSTNLTTVISTSVDSGLSCAYAVLMPVNKLHDAITSVLPQPQFGNASGIGLSGNAPVYALNSDVPSTGAPYITSSPYSVKFWSLGTNSINKAIGDDSRMFLHVDPMDSRKTKAIDGVSVDYSNIADNIVPGNLWADLSQASAVTINSLRSAVMYQRYLEALARGGRRVPEYYESIYGVKNSTARKDYPEMISHNRFMLGVNQVVATADSSGSGWTSHLGDTGAYSLTNLKDIPLSDRDFTEFGYLHVLLCVRADNRYSQMVPEHFFRSELLDEYNPFFDHIGDVGIPNYMVNIDAVGAAGNFGYQEAWWSERTQLSLCCGPLNKSYGSLSYWTVSELLGTSVLTCTPGFLTFDPGVFNDIFVSAYYTYPQFIFDILIHGNTNKRMSQHSIPGIVGRI